MNKKKETQTKLLKIITSVILTIFLIGIFFLLWVQMINAKKEANNAQRDKDIQYIGQLLEKYHDRYGAYPCSVLSSASSCVWEQELLKVSEEKPIPNDPLTHENYIYFINDTNGIIAAKWESVEYMLFYLPTWIGTQGKSYTAICLKDPDYVKLWNLYRTVDKKIVGTCTDKLENISYMYWNLSNK